MIAMCFQSNDSQLHAYCSLFNDATQAFIMKPEDYLEKIICVPVAPPKKLPHASITAVAPELGASMGE